MTIGVMWKVLAWGLTFHLPQQIIISRIASQGVSNVTHIGIF